MKLHLQMKLETMKLNFNFYRNFYELLLFSITLFQLYNKSFKLILFNIQKTNNQILNLLFNKLKIIWCLFLKCFFISKEYYLSNFISELKLKSFYKPFNFK